MASCPVLHVVALRGACSRIRLRSARGALANVRLRNGSRVRRYYTFDHRRLWCMYKAGCPRLRFQVKLCGRDALVNIHSLWSSPETRAFSNIHSSRSSLETRAFNTVMKFFFTMPSCTRGMLSIAIIACQVQNAQTGRGSRKYLQILHYMPCPRSVNC